MGGDRDLIVQLADGRFHSGEALARTSGVSRTAIWKRLQQLRTNLGLSISAVRGRGYRLDSPIELLDEQAIRRALPSGTRNVLAGFEVCFEIDSTNAYLLRSSRDAIAGARACFAEHQSAGRGRRGRRWISPFGSNLYLSLLWVFERGSADLSGLSLAVAVSVVRALQKFGVDDVHLKWPNDILWQGRKLSGVLLEMRGELDGPCTVVTGVGLNIRMARPAASEIDQPWTDLYTILGAVPSRNQLAASVLSELVTAMREYQHGGLESFLDEWRARDRLAGEPVVLVLPDRRIRGTARGIDDSGALLLDEHGELRAHRAGEVSLRAL